ncbi:MAG: alpha-mannosidase [Acholeplasmataceae bacterium]|nr:alpha-mannosidase [Acholeplasmataceae bacterium]
MKKIHLVSNAHIDPVWQWEWQEGVGVAITTFSAAADFCEEFDNFIFCHNEALLYEWVERYDPPLFKRIQKLVKEGKWHIMGGWYIQPDCNMPTGESFIRQITKGLNYFESKFENFKRPTTAINFDSFGHTRGLVQILNDAGYDSYVIHRPPANEDEVSMVWKGFNNSEVVVARVNDGYNSLLGQVDKKLLPFLNKTSEVKNELFLWGVGNHGGGPSRQDYKIISELANKYKHIEFIHSTPERYFKEVFKYKNKLKTIDYLPLFNRGAYTSQILMKQFNRRLENELFSAEKMAMHAHFNGMKYPSEALLKIEEDLLFNQFHDILPGTDIKEGEDAAIRVYGHGIEEAQRVKMQSFMVLTKGQEKAKDGEYPVFVYNLHPYKVKTTIECEFMLADQNRSLTDFYDIEVYHKDKLIPSQIEKESSNLPLDWRKKVVFDSELTPFSIERFSCFTVLKPVKSKKIEQKYLFDNGTLKVSINKNTGLIESLIIDSKEYLENQINVNFTLNNYDPWGFFYDDNKTKLGSFKLMTDEEVKKFTDVSSGKNINIIEDGEIRTVVQAFFKFNESKLVLNYIIPKKGKLFKIDMTLLNLERDVKIKLSIPTTLKNDKYYGKTAFGINEMPADGNEKVAQEYLYITDRDKTLGLINFGNYGSDCINGSINQTLINSSGYCAHPIDDREVLKKDRFNSRIDIGERKFTFIIYAGETKEVLESLDFISLINHQRPFVLNYFPTGSGKKPNPFITLDNKNIQLVAVKESFDKKGIIIRLFNPLIDVQKTIVDFNDNSLKFNVVLNKYEFKTYKIIENCVVEVNCLEKENLT